MTTSKKTIPFKFLYNEIKNELLNKHQLPECLEYDKVSYGMENTSITSDQFYNSRLVGDISYGNSEGIYLDFYFLHFNEESKIPQKVPFATFKSLDTGNKAMEDFGLLLSHVLIVHDSFSFIELYEKFQKYDPEKIMLTDLNKSFPHKLLPKLFDYLRQNSEPHSSFEEPVCFMRKALSNFISDYRDFQIAYDHLCKVYIDDNGDHMGSDAFKTISDFNSLIETELVPLAKTFKKEKGINCGR